MDRSEFTFKRRNVVACATAFVMAASLSLPVAAFADEEGHVATEPASAVAADAQPDVEPEGAIPIDKGEAYDEAPEVSSPIALFSYTYTRITPMQLSDDMKYFTLYESGRNYDQGFSYGDGYHAMGYYQFDNRYSLQDFMQGCYWYDSNTFSMFKWATDSSVDLSSSPMAVNGQLTELGQKAQDSWHAAYAAAPGLFSQLQDGYAYTTYYLPAERYLGRIGVDISDRNDAVKGLSWGLCVLFGSGGMQYYFDHANLTSGMTDTEFVTNVCNSVIDNVASRVNNYASSYQNRYKRELATCLDIIDRTGDTRASAPEQPNADGSNASAGNDAADTPNGGATSGAGESTSDSAESNDSGSNNSSSSNGGVVEPSQPNAPDAPSGDGNGSGAVADDSQGSSDAQPDTPSQPSNDASEPAKPASPSTDASGAESSNSGSSTSGESNSASSGSSDTVNAGTNNGDASGPSSDSGDDKQSDVKQPEAPTSPVSPSVVTTPAKDASDQDITQLSLNKTVDAGSDAARSGNGDAAKASSPDANNTAAQSQANANAPQQTKKLSETNDGMMGLFVAMAAAAVAALVVIGVVVFRMTRRNH